MPLKRSAGDPSGAPKRTRFASPPPNEAGPSRQRARETSGDSGSNGGKRGGAGAGGDDDLFLDADITEANRGAKKREKRVLKDTDGYGSDSSNDDGEGVVPSRRADAKEDEDDDGDVDMFAEEPAEPVDKGKGKDKAKGGDKEFMSIDEIEGQEAAPVAADEEGSDSDAEMAAKRKTGLDGDMGVEITPFNMKKEMEEGRFTADGEAYMENDKDEHDKHDSWLDAVDKDAIKKARRAHREREALEAQREAREAETSGVGSEEREHELMRAAVGLLERGETVLEALQRLGKEADAKAKKDGAGKKKSWAERQKERKAHASDPEHVSPFTKLSDIVSALSAIGQLDVYSLSREAIQRMLPREPEPERPAAAAPPPRDTRSFQYRFSMAYIRTLPEGQRPVEREVFGPFSAQQLAGWKVTGFFGPNCENVEVRQTTGGQEGAWGMWADVVG